MRILALTLTLMISTLTWAQSYQQLDKFTAGEFATDYAAHLNKKLNACFELYKVKYKQPNRQYITKPMLGFLFTLSNNSSPQPNECGSNAYDSQNVFRKLFESTKKSRMKLKTLSQALKPWLLQTLKLKEVSLMTTKSLYNLIELSYLDYYFSLAYGKEKALENAEDSEFLASLYEKWELVKENGFDKYTYSPIKINSDILETDELFNVLQEAFEYKKIHVTLVSTGFKAVDDFWQAQDGPEGQPQFAPLAKLLKSNNIKKRFFFQAAGDDHGPWSRNILVVIDQYNQTLPFFMGYSE